MCRAHLDPEEAVDAFLELRARFMLPIHYDTFVNSLDEVGKHRSHSRAPPDRRG